MTNKVKAWSYSRYADFEQCPARFKYKHIDRMPDGGSAAMDRGIKIHDEVAKFLTGELKAAPASLKHFAQQAAELREMNPLVEQQWGFTATWKPVGFFANDVWCRGIVDAGVVYEDNTADIIDHKTGKMYKTNEDQVELFSLTAMCRYPSLTHVTARLWYLDSGDEVIAEYTAKDREALKRKWEAKVSPMFREEVFAPKPNDKCKWCAYSASKEGPCRYG